MLQNKEIPTITNVTKEGLPTTTTTIKKSIVENQTSGKIKTNVTKEGYQQQQYQQKNYQQQQTNVTKEGIPTTTKIPSNTNKN